MATAKKQKPRKTKGQYYVGQQPSKMTPLWMKDSLEAAIDHGKKMLADRPDLTFVNIVKVVYQIYRAATPVKVKKVR